MIAPVLVKGFKTKTIYAGTASLFFYLKVGLQPRSFEITKGFVFIISVPPAKV
jgi:hypothetical protein